MKRLTVNFGRDQRVGETTIYDLAAANVENDTVHGNCFL
jgi:hypothetical protein